MKVTVTMHGEFFFGLVWPEIAKKIEKLPGATSKNLPKYQFPYGTVIRIPRNVYLATLEGLPLDSVELENPKNNSGCIRAEPFKKFTTEEKKRYLDAFTLNSVNAHIAIDQQEEDEYVADSSATAQYRLMQLKNRSGTRLQVLRSNIQGWGVFAKKPIKKGEMIIEYVGEVISAALEDKREAFYDTQELGCYMFRVPDEEETVDATMKGNIARFINHSCNPNAKTDHIIIGQTKKIIIYAICDISPGEEIAYNYMFAIDDEDKVPCSCGAPNCKGYMNV